MKNFDRRMKVSTLLDSHIDCSRNMLPGLLARTLARKTRQLQPLQNVCSRSCSRSFARKAGRGGTNNGRRRNNRNGKGTGKELVRGANYEEPSGSAATGMIYRLGGALGACAAVTGYLFFVYNPGVGDRRYGKQKRENDEYFEDQADEFQAGDWDNGPSSSTNQYRGNNDGNDSNFGDADDGYGFGDTGDVDDGATFNEEDSDVDPYANKNRESKWARNNRRPSTEANNRGTWA